MKINGITTIVDLAFNLSGSLAGIPVILPQLPVGERVGFDTLPEVWDDVDDVGQTWTPNLDGVEVDITVEAYNPTAIQKAPYSTDMKCIDVASEWGAGIFAAADWESTLEVGGLSLATGAEIDDPDALRTSAFLPIIGSNYILDSIGLYSDNTVVGSMILYDESYNRVDYWNLTPNTLRTVPVGNAKYFKFTVKDKNYIKGTIKIVPVNI